MRLNFFDHRGFITPILNQTTWIFSGKSVEILAWRCKPKTEQNRPANGVSDVFFLFFLGEKLRFWYHIKRLN